MKITIPRSQLLDAVSKVRTVVSAKSALPILSHILFQSSDSAVKLSATDLKVSIECSVDCTVHTPGALTISAQRLASILSELPEGDITLGLGDNSVVTLDSGAIQTKFYSMSPEEFPAVRDFAGVEPIILDQLALKKLFSKTSFAISGDQARYNLTGLLVELKGGKLTAVATDGRRMSLCCETEGIPEGIDLKVIVPGKMINELERLLGDDAEVRVQIDETQAAFAFDNIRLVTALIEGSFPPYENVIPKRHDKEGLLPLGPFTDAVRRTRTMTNDKFNSVRFKLSPGKVTLKVVTPEVGEYLEELPVEYDGEEIEIAFNPDFILDVVRRMEGETLVVQLKDAMSPGLFKPYTEAPSDSYLNVIMPIRI